ncbi:hypothetical protein V8C43DRAFT_11889 [Trichoderma afarasin]
MMHIHLLFHLLHSLDGVGWITLPHHHTLLLKCSTNRPTLVKIKTSILVILTQSLIPTAFHLEPIVLSPKSIITYQPVCKPWLENPIVDLHDNNPHP